MDIDSILYEIKMLRNSIDNIGYVLFDFETKNLDLSQKLCELKDDFARHEQEHGPVNSKVVDP